MKKLLTLLLSLFIFNVQSQSNVCFTGVVENYPVGSYSIKVISADFNNDGIKDLVNINHSESTITLALGNGLGAFSSFNTFPTVFQPYGISAADFNSDGNMDLAVLSYKGPVSILLGNGTGNFGTPNNYSVGWDNFGLTVSDFNNDGILDLAALSIMYSKVYVLLGVGDGTFGSATSFSTGYHPYNVAAADCNSDGKMDLIVTNTGANTVSILLGDGLGSFTTFATVSSGISTNEIITGDFNEDGAVDFAVTNNTSHNISVFIGVGNGNFLPSVYYPTGTEPIVIVAADYNHDGHLDLAVTDDVDHKVSILLGVGNGTFGAVTNYLTTNKAFGLATADFNGDGWCDLAYSTTDTMMIEVKLNIPPVGVPVFSAGPTIVCQDSLDTTYTATATNALSIAYSVLPSAAGVINTSTGVMNWNAAFNGQATITATATGCNSSLTATVTVVVNPLPTVTVGLGSSIICPNTTTTVTATPGTAGTYSYAWTVPSGATNPGDVASFTTGVAGVYKVVITNTATGCSSAQALSSVLSISTTCTSVKDVCGTTLASIDDPILGYIVANAQGYRWRVTKMIAGIPSTNPADVQTLDTGLRSMKLTQLTTYAFDTAYQIEIAVRLSNVWASNYGSACVVRTPATTTKVINSQCGSQVALLTDAVYANLVAYATGYRFKITNLLSNDVQIIDRQLREFRFSLLSTIAFNAPYKVEVAIRNTDGTYLPYGLPCTVTTPSFPTSYLQNSQCDYTATNMNEVIYANIVTNATAYRFTITNSSLSYSYTFDSNLRSFVLNSVPGLVGSATYTVQVAVQIGGAFGPYGKSCGLTTPAALNAKEEFASSTMPPTSMEFEAIAVPNPFTDDFKLNVKTASDAPLEVKVYDMLGQLVESKAIATTEIETFAVGASYPSGVYLVLVSQGNTAKTLRMIKR